MTNAIPNYSAWSRDDLLNETSKLATRQARLCSEQGDESAIRIKIAETGARYHAAMLALVELAEPFDPDALARREQTLAWHRKERERYYAIALGTARIQQLEGDPAWQQ